jgi:hypothetical protein
MLSEVWGDVVMMSNHDGRLPSLCGLHLQMYVNHWVRAAGQPSIEKHTKVRKSDILRALQNTQHAGITRVVPYSMLLV